MRDLYTCESCGFLSTRRDHYVRVFLAGIPQETSAHSRHDDADNPARMAGFMPLDSVPYTGGILDGLFATMTGPNSRLLCRSCKAVAEHNTTTIGDIPRTILPDGPARDELVTRARMGEDLYAYSAGTGTEEVWNLWIEARADATPARNGRVPVAEWYAAWMQTHMPTLPNAQTGQERAAVLG